MIPKIIHYCWFGGNPLPEQLQDYINNWKNKCPDWEIKLWDEKSFDINSQIFTQSAYQQKKYAFVSDYVRAWALNEFGGVYLDTDVEIKLSIDHFLQYEAFSGFEAAGLPFTAVWGAMPRHSLTKKVLTYYDNRIYSDQEPPNTSFISDIICNDFKINRHYDITQVGFDGLHHLHIFSSSYFCLDLPKNYTTHHFFGSWLDNHAKEKPYKSHVHNQYYISKIEPEFFFEKDQLKSLANTISFWNILIIIRHYLKSKFK